MTRKLLNNDDDEKIVEGNYEDISNAELDNDDELASIIKEIGADDDIHEYTMRVYRLPRGGGKMVWLFDSDPRVSVHARLRDEHDGGTFELRVYKNNRIFKRPRIDIEAPKRENYQRPASNEINQTDMFALFERSQQKLVDGIAQLLKTNVQPQATISSPVDQMTSMLSMMTMMKDFSGEKEKADPFESIKQALELKELFSGGSGDGDTTNADVIIAAMKHIGGPLSEMTKNANRAVKAPAHKKIAATKKKQVEDKGGGNINFLTIGISMLVGAAEKNEDPAPYVDVILQRLAREQIEAFLTNEDAMELMISINPRAANHPIWFRELSSLLNEQLQESKQTDVQDEDGDNRNPEISQAAD